MGKYMLDRTKECYGDDRIIKNKGRMFNSLEEALFWISPLGKIAIEFDEPFFNSKVYVYEFSYDEMIAVLIPEFNCYFSEVKQNGHN